MVTTNDGSNKENVLKVLEKLTTNAAEIQDQVLLQILSQNVNTEYLSRFYFHHCLNDINLVKQAFRERVPIVDYEDIRDYIQRVASGEPSHIICAQPIAEFITSSGTSGGQPKLIPATAEEIERRSSFRNLAAPVIRYVEGMDQGKVMSIVITEPDIRTPSGLIARPISTSYCKNDPSKKQPKNPSTSPKDTILCSDSKQSMYCQLLCGLVQRDEVLQIATTFVLSILRVVKFLETYWKEICSNIRTGHLSDWITDISCRNAAVLVLGKPSPELADLIEKECGGRSWEGIITRLWPRTKYINAINTGSMAQYIPAIEFYCDQIPLVSTIYGSSESLFGINLNPFSKSSDVTYTLLPNLAYFEFLPVIKDHDKEDKVLQHSISGLSNTRPSEQVIDLIDVQVGHCYEFLITTYTGLYRYRVGDVLMVTGFHNNAPQFRFVERKNVILSVAMDKTTEDDLMKAIAQAKLPIEQQGFLLSDYTSYADTSSIPGHYVLFWELVKNKLDNGGQEEVDPVVMEECCSIMEKMLDSMYRRLRKDMIGPLEIRLVKQGTFDELMEFSVAKGASVNQFKMMRCVKSEEVINILNSRAVGRYFSNNVPSWEPSEILDQISK